MVSRANFNAFAVKLVVPYGCLSCCYAPECMPCCALLPCVKDPKYIVKELEASKYIYIRENSLEWNQPMKVNKEGDCCGFSCSVLKTMSLSYTSMIQCLTPSLISPDVATTARPSASELKEN